jgi:hypothetical protein
MLLPVLPLRVIFFPTRLRQAVDVILDELPTFSILSAVSMNTPTNPIITIPTSIYRMRMVMMSKKGVPGHYRMIHPVSTVSTS